MINIFKRRSVKLRAKYDKLFAIEKEIPLKIETAKEELSSIGKDVPFNRKIVESKKTKIRKLRKEYSEALDEIMMIESTLKINEALAAREQ